MHATVLVLTAVLGSALAAYVDVQTTEIPDMYGLAMAGIGIFAHLVHGLVTGSYTALWHGLVLGAVFGLIGYGLYRMGAWGGADTVLLAALAVLVPGFTGFSTVFPGVWPVAVTFFVNIWVVGAVYELVYIGVLLGGENREYPSLGSFVDVRSRRFLFVAGTYIAVAVGAGAVAAAVQGVSPVPVLFRFAVFSPFIVVFVALFNGLKWVEQTVMQTTVPVEEVERGDMVAEPVNIDGVSVSADTVRGLTAEEAAAIQKSDMDAVRLRTGISFAPVFPLAVLLTVFFGDVIVFVATIL